MSQFGLKKQKAKPPNSGTRNRFSTFTTDDLYLTFEQSIGHSIHEMDMARSDPKARDMHMQNVQVHLETALQAVEAMRSKSF